MIAAPQRLAWLLAVILQCAAAVSTAAPRPPEFIGRWYLDPVRSEVSQPDIKESRGNPLGNVSVRPSVTIGGIPLPSIPRGEVPELEGSAKDPAVLRCRSFSVMPTDRGLEFHFDNVGSETFRHGHYRGMDTRWSRKRMHSSYATSSRKVYQTFELEDPDTLVVEVKLRPKEGPKRTFKQVFTRQPAPVAAEPPAEK